MIQKFLFRKYFGNEPTTRLENQRLFNPHENQLAELRDRYFDLADKVIEG